jgi:hypothetical protein
LEFFKSRDEDKGLGFLYHNFILFYFIYLFIYLLSKEACGGRERLLMETLGFRSCGTSSRSRVLDCSRELDENGDLFFWEKRPSDRGS